MSPIKLNWLARLALFCPGLIFQAVPISRLIHLSGNLTPVRFSRPQLSSAVASRQKFSFSLRVTRKGCRFFFTGVTKWMKSLYEIVNLVKFGLKNFLQRKYKTKINISHYIKGVGLIFLNQKKSKI